MHALIGGGNWNNGVHDGSRTVNCNNYPWNVNTNIGVWCVCDYLETFRLVELRLANKDYLIIIIE
nr:MAG TPA: hypothetical protein [Bacteriophage sp.]DAN21942.1 MAG TPA_asm: hypothetical protein [Bacteriophage sp.]